MNQPSEPRIYATWEEYWEDVPARASTEKEGWFPLMECRDKADTYDITCMAALSLARSGWSLLQKNVQSPAAAAEILRSLAHSDTRLHEADDASFAVGFYYDIGRILFDLFRANDRNDREAALVTAVMLFSHWVDPAQRSEAMSKRMSAIASGPRKPVDPVKLLCFVRDSGYPEKMSRHALAQSASEVFRCSRSTIERRLEDLGI